MASTKTQIGHPQEHNSGLLFFEATMIREQRSEGMTELILGGARSGKSCYAERQAQDWVGRVVYIATATAGDEEMSQRIEHHRRRRPVGWTTVEAPMALADALQRHAAPEACLVVDCLTLWLSNVLFDAAGEADEVGFREQRAALLACLPRLPGRVLLVSNEVGHGVVPANPMARRFVDEAGWLHQDLAALCRRVVWVAAGLPQILKEEASDA